MPLWSDRIAQDSAALEDFLKWIEERRTRIVQAVFDKKIALDDAITSKNLLDELERCANMNRREEQANGRYNGSVARSTAHQRG